MGLSYDKIRWNWFRDMMMLQRKFQQLLPMTIVEIKKLLCVYYPGSSPIRTYVPLPLSLPVQPPAVAAPVLPTFNNSYINKRTLESKN